MSAVKGLVIRNANTFNLQLGKKLILGIGINDYQSREWPRLNNAVHDVQVMTSLLMEKYDFDDCSLLLDKEATRANIENTLYRYTDSNVLGENDSLLVYYSGHGHLDSNQLGYWVPVDAEMGKIHTYIPNGRLRELISNFKCRHVLLISDACFSGSFFAQYKGASIQEEIAAEYERRVSRYAFCSGRHDQVVSDGRKGENSPFAKAIIQELNLNNTKINLSRLAERVIDLTRANYNQMPIADPIFETGHMGGQFVFTPRGYFTNAAETPNENLLENIQTRTRNIHSPALPRNQFPWAWARLIGVAGFILLLGILGFNAFSVPVAKLMVEPAFISVKEVTQNEPQNIEFSVVNVGKGKAVLHRLEFENQDFTSSDQNDQLLKPGQKKRFKVAWIPRELGLKTYLIKVSGENIEKDLMVKVQAHVREKLKPNPPKNTPGTIIKKPKTNTRSTEPELELLH